MTDTKVYELSMSAQDIDDKLIHSVQYSEQELTPDQKLQARKNIGVSVDAVNVKNYGAMGDGKTDDTEAIRTARIAAITENKALYFPSGTYIVHGSIELWNNCEIYGDGSRTVIKKKPAIVDVIKPRGTAGNFTLGQHVFTVSDGTRYTVGDDCCVGINWQNFEYTLHGRIADITGNNVTVQSFPKRKAEEVLLEGLEDWQASEFNRETVKVTFSTSYPVLCTYRYNSDGTQNNLHDVYIHDLTLDGNRQPGEPAVYHLSTLHLDYLDNTNTDTAKLCPVPHENIRLENLNAYNSAADGISIQSSKNVHITNCTTKNCGYNGIHFGVGTAIGSIVGCKLNADYCGYYDCAGVSSISIANNHFEDCKVGAGGFDGWTRGLTINGNTFRGCGIGVHVGSLKYPENITADMPDKVYVGTTSTGTTVCNNTFYGVDFTGIGISCAMGHFVIINGNTFRDLDTAIETGKTNGFYISNNMILDCVTPVAMGSSANDPTNRNAIVNNSIAASLAGTSAAIVVKNADKMLLTGNIIYGNNASLTIEDTAKNVVEENNIVHPT